MNIKKNRTWGLTLITCFVFFSCQQKPASRPGPVPVNLITVQSKPVLYYDNFPATTEALSQVDIRPQVQGYVTGIFFTEGSHVKEGQKLYEIDERLYQAAYDQAKANLKVAQGNKTQAQQDADRYRYLIAHNAVAKQVADHAFIALENANNEVLAAEQAVKTAATNLTFSVIKAPFDGTIGFSLVKLGNMVSIGTTIMNTISTDNPMAVDFLINEAQLGHYQDLYQNKQHHIDSLFTVVLPNHKIYQQTGHITVVDRAVDPQTGTIRVRLVFPNPSLELRAGMSCVVRVHNQEMAPQMVVPGKSIVEQMGEYFVYIARDTIMSDSANKKEKTDTAQSPKLRAFEVRVQPGATIGADIIIQSGINDGDRIVVDGIQALHDGSEITASTKPAPGSNRQGADRKTASKSTN
ncbi:MAG TPA: efflux RND transporter periplasmic adaptor subunit [Puia sp.]|nr:efflux RND transporter periplasmic adaptor subunit [Puia sp.]